MFERYNEKARRAIFFARYEASNSGSSTIEAEHLLLGAVRESGLGATMLDAMRTEILKVSPPGAPLPASMDLPVSQAFKRAMAHASEEADKLGHQYIGVEHLLLGLMAGDPDSLVPTLLRKHGIDRAKALSDIADAPVEDPVNRESLRALVESLPSRFLQPAKRMLEHMQAPRPLVPPPPFGAEGSGFGGGAGWSFRRPGTWGTPPRPMRQGRRSMSRIEEGAEVVETHHLRDGCEITLVERFRLSEDSKTLSYTQEITGPGKSEQHTIDFEISPESGKNPG